MKLDQKTQENIVRGNYSELLITIAIALGTFSFFSPRVFVLLDYFFHSVNAKINTFQIFYCTYLILPIIGFILLFKLWIKKEIRAKDRLLIIKKRKLTTIATLTISSFVVFVINILGVVISDQNGLTRSAFNKYEEYKICIEDLNQTAKGIKKIENQLLLIESRELLSGGKHFKSQNSYFTPIKLSETSVSNQLDEILKNYHFYKDYQQAFTLELVSKNLLIIKRESINEHHVKTAKKKFVKLFEAFQIVSIVALLVILLVLMLILFIYHKQSRLTKKEGFLIKALIGSYILMAIQMIQPIKVGHINLYDNGFQFKYNNWYLPSFITSQINEVNNYDQRAFDINNEYDNKAVVDNLVKLNETLISIDTKVVNVNSILESRLKTDTLSLPNDILEIKNQIDGLY